MSDVGTRKAWIVDAMGGCMKARNLVIDARCSGKGLGKQASEVDGSNPSKAGMSY